MSECSSARDPEADESRRKRSRIEEDVGEERKRHDVLWFEDGTVVLSTKTTLFRVYRGILCQHSIVFRDMFSFPQENTAKINTLDGIPVVDLHDDPVELSYFLRALHDASYYNQFLSCEFAVVAAILRLSTKYQVDDFRLRAFTHLQSFYPDKWKTFASRNHDVRILNPDHYQMLSLARECDLPVFLPAVYFLICEAMRPLPGGLSPWKEANPDFRQLSKDDLVAIFLAREELHKVAENTILRFREEYLSIEGEADQCGDCYVPVASSVFSEMTRMARVSDIFAPMVYHRIIQTVRNKYFCDACSKKYRMFFEREAEHTWNRLPCIFGFESWHTLRNSSGLEGRNAKRITLISNWVNPIVIYPRD